MQNSVMNWIHQNRNLLKFGNSNLLHIKYATLTFLKIMFVGSDVPQSVLEGSQKISAALTWREIYKMREQQDERTAWSGNSMKREPWDVRQNEKRTTWGENKKREQHEERTTRWKNNKIKRTRWKNKELGKLQDESERATIWVNNKRREQQLSWE